MIVKCNWNLAVNSFNEGYHMLYIPRHSVPDYQGGKLNQLDVVKFETSGEINPAVRNMVVSHLQAAGAGR